MRAAIVCFCLAGFLACWALAPGRTYMVMRWVSLVFVVGAVVAMGVANLMGVE